MPFCVRLGPSGVFRRGPRTPSAAGSECIGSRGGRKDIIPRYGNAGAQMQTPVDYIYCKAQIAVPIRLFINRVIPLPRLYL